MTLRTGRFVLEGSGALFCRAVEARSVFARMKGLLGRSGLPVGEGLWIRPCSAIHTLGMRFAISVVFLDRALRVVRIVENVPPGRFWVGGGRGAQSVLELPSEEEFAARVKVGDRLIFERDG